MAGELLQYSGLITKTRAMRSRLLKREDFERITEFLTVEETIAFLREQESYGRIYGGREEIRHRGQVEELIHNSILEDYRKLYLFGNSLRDALDPQKRWNSIRLSSSTEILFRMWKYPIL